MTVDMMSDEEKRGDMYVRHQPSYRFDVLNAFIKNIDRSAAYGSFHAKFQRYSDNVCVPSSAKRWIVKAVSDAVETAGVSRYIHTLILATVSSMHNNGRGSLTQITLYIVT